MSNFVCSPTPQSRTQFQQTHLVAPVHKGPIPDNDKVGYGKTSSFLALCSAQRKKQQHAVSLSQMTSADGAISRDWLCQPMV